MPKTMLTFKKDELLDLIKMIYLGEYMLSVVNGGEQDVKTKEIQQQIYKKARGSGINIFVESEDQLMIDPDKEEQYDSILAFFMSEVIFEKLLLEIVNRAILEYSLKENEVNEFVRFVREEWDYDGFSVMTKAYVDKFKKQ